MLRALSMNTLASFGNAELSDEKGDAMTCPKCKGFVLLEWSVDVSCEFEEWRCVNCGFRKPTRSSASNLALLSSWSGSRLVRTLE